MPNHVILRISMDEEQGRALAAGHQIDFCARSFDVLLRKPFEHRRPS
jgi:hypothetical protein